MQDEFGGSSFGVGGVKHGGEGGDNKREYSYAKRG